MTRAQSARLDLAGFPALGRLLRWPPPLESPGPPRDLRPGPSTLAPQPVAGSRSLPRAHLARAGLRRHPESARHRVPGPGDALLLALRGPDLRAGRLLPPRLSGRRHHRDLRELRPR